MADDDAGPASSTPWGRPGGRDSATPPPPPAPAPLTPPPTTAAPTWATPPPGPYPPPPGRTGMSRGALVALAAVVVVALVVVGAGVFLVTSLGGDDEPDDVDLRTSATVPATDGPSSSPSSSTSTSSTTEAGSPIGPGGTVSVPATGTDFAPPAAFPQPEGAAPDGITGGLEVPGTSEDALAFYEGALPGAGFTATRADLPGIVALEVTGDGLAGQLLFVDIGLGTTTVLWQPA